MPDFYLVKLVEEKIVFDSLPVGKVTRYPLEKNSYKPYAQCSLAVAKCDLAVRFMAFECAPLPESKMELVLYPFLNKPEQALVVEVTPKKKPKLWVGSPEYSLPIQSRLRAGEDLQGAFWGWDIECSLKEIERFGALLFDQAGSLLGNVYKLQEHIPEHYGSLFPVALADKESFTPVGRLAKQNRGIIPIVSY